MTRRLSRALAIGLVLLLGMSGVIFAARMAPDRSTAALEAHRVAHGIAAADLCGDTGHADHRCPLCHGLPVAPQPAHTGPELLFRPHEAWALGADLYRAAQARNINHSPRAPPATA